MAGWLIGRRRHRSEPDTPPDLASPSAPMSNTHHGQNEENNERSDGHSRNDVVPAGVFAYWRSCWWVPRSIVRRNKGVPGGRYRRHEWDGDVVVDLAYLGGIELGAGAVESP